MTDISRVQIYKCTEASIPELWPIVEDWFVRALDVAPPYWKIGHLQDMALSGDYVLWLATINEKPCGAALAEFIRHYGTLVCNVPWIGGKGMKTWFPALQNLVEKWARDAHAEYIGGAGRRGWIRAAGMKEIGTILIKEL